MRNKPILWLSLFLVLITVFVASCDKKVDEGGAVNTSSQSSAIGETTTGDNDVVYHLDIEDDIMASPRVLSMDELDDCGYFFKDVSEQFDCDEAALAYIKLSEHETSTIELLYTQNTEKSIHVEVSDQMISAEKLIPRADITICLESCTVRVYDWGVDESNPINLNPEVEAVLRTVLCIK